MPVRKTAEQVELIFQRLETAAIEVAIIGTSPTICNRMAEKARQSLLLPSGRKNAADKAANLKHDPIAEFRSAPYRFKDPSSPTLLGIPSGAFKKSMQTGALSIPGASKAEIGRLVFVDGDLVPLYGEPKLLMSVVRSSDINHTPDIRTRVIVPNWATLIRIRYVTPLLKPASVLNLLAAGGLTAGIGDWRPEKGGDHGLFELTTPDDPRFTELLEAGRATQERALAEPVPYDVDSEDLLDWYESEYLRRMGSSMPVTNGAAQVEEEELEVVV